LKSYLNNALTVSLVRGGKSMYAIVTTGGKQYKVSQDEIINVEKLDAKVGDKINLDVLMTVDGDKVVNGNPFVKGAEVVAEVVEQGKSEKVLVFKYKAKKNERKRQGHRQQYTKVQIDEVKA
jgi:large subunit ribosomal protein L21